MCEIINEKNPLKFSELARRLQCLPLSISQWCGGMCLPREETRRRIAEILGIPASAWTDVPHVGDGLVAGETARDALNRVCNSYGSAGRIAAACGIHPSRMSAIRRDGRPSPRDAIALEQVTGVPALAWARRSGQWHRNRTWICGYAEIAGGSPATARAMLSTWAEWFVAPGNSPDAFLGMPEGRIGEILGGSAPNEHEIASMERDIGGKPGIPARWWAT